MTSARNRKNVSPPMHHVKLNRMPLLRTATGCRWRNTLDMTAMTRVRRSRGTPWRKIEFHNCELRTQSKGAAKLIRAMRCYFGFWTADCGLEDETGPASPPQSAI